MPDTLNYAAQRALECVSSALSDALRPVCKTYQTVGTPVVATCCECDDQGANGEVSIHFTRMFDADPNTLEEILRVRPCKGGTLAAQYRLVLARCYPTIDEHGELPDPQDVADKAVEQMLDAELIWRALTCCTELRIRVDDITTDPGPMGGCSVTFADITVQIQTTADPVLTEVEPGIYYVSNAVIIEPEPGEYELN